jgi:hypothetical protein
MSQLLQRSPAVEGVALDEQEILFHSATNKFVLLNPAARFVWTRLAAAGSAAQIAAALCARHGRAADAQAEAQVASFLAALAARSLVAPATGTADAREEPVAPVAAPYHAPMLRDVTEDEVLASFQMTAAEISAASCWWFSCATGCP